MSDQNSDQSLAGDEPSDTVLPPALGGPSVVEQILDVEHVLNSAKLVERTARICLRADLEADLHDTLKELGTLVDERGNVIEGLDASLAESNAARANFLNSKSQEISQKMQAETFIVRFRGMDEDAWDAFEKANRTNDGKAKPNIQTYGNKLVAATAIEPTITEAKFAAMRKALGSKQIETLVATAYSACTQGGLDIPKLPSFLADQKPAVS